MNSNTETITATNPNGESVSFTAPAADIRHMLTTATERGMSGRTGGFVAGAQATPVSGDRIRITVWSATTIAKQTIPTSAARALTA